MIAAAYGNAKTVGILISKGADVYIRDSSKQTARELAAKKGKKEVLAVMDKFRR
jgi:ankyrin repeat protein